MRRIASLLLAGLLIHPMVSCGGSGGGGSAEPPPPPTYTPPFLLSSTSASGRLEIPDGTSRQAIQRVTAFCAPRPVAADGTFGPLEVTEGSGGLFLAFLDAGGDLVVPAFVSGDPLIVGLDEVIAGLLAFTDWGVSVGRRGMDEYLALVRACAGYPVARSLLADALLLSASILDGPSHPALYEALAACAAEAFDAWVTAGATATALTAQGASGRVVNAGLCDTLDTNVGQVDIRQGESGGLCGIYAVNPSCVFYGLEIAPTQGNEDFRSLLLPARSGLFDLNWFTDGLSLNPNVLRPTPPSTKALFPIGGQDLAGNYEARAYKRKSLGGGSRAAELASAANTIYGCVIVMDIAMRIYTDVPILGKVSDVLEKLAGDPEAFVALIEEMEQAESGPDAALAVLSKLMVDDDAEPQTPEGRLERLLERFVTEPQHPSKIASFLYTKHGIGVVDDWSSAMKAGWAIHKAWKQALAVLGIAGTANRALPYFWDLLFRPDLVSLCFTIDGNGALTTPDLTCRTFSLVPVFSTVPRVPAPGDAVVFDATKTVDGGTGVVSYLWDFNLDDGDATLASSGTNPTTGHIYDTAGTYRVLLRVQRGTETRDLVRSVAVLPTELDYRATLAVPVGTAPIDLVSGDLDGDLDNDAIATVTGPGFLAVLHNAGRGVLTLEKLIGLGATPGSVAVGDIDGDQDLDVAVSLGGGATVGLLRNDGNLQFVRQPDVKLPIGTVVASLRLADVEGNGRADLVVADSGRSQAIVWRSDGTFSFADPAGSLHREYTVDVRPIDIVCEDLDGDHDLDLVTANVTGDTLSVLEGDGAGGFAVRQLGLPAGFQTYGGPQWLATGDVVKGGDIEVAVTNSRANSIALFRRRTGVPTLELEALSSDWLVGESLGRIRLADVDDDGFVDLVRVRETKNDLVVHYLDGTWNDPAGKPKAFVATDAAPRGFAAIDLNGDRRLDLVTANALSDEVTVTLGASGRAFDVRTDLLTRDDVVGDEPYDVAVSRLYSDDFEPAAPRTSTGLDLAVVTRLTNRLVLYRNRDGRGDFRREQTLTTASQPLDVAIGNLDGDPEPEIVVACNQGNSISVFDRGADGRYALVENVATDQEPLRVEIANIDGVGLPEVVVLHYNPSRVTILRPALGSSPALQVVPGGVTGGVALAHDLAVGSLDADGRADFVASNYFAGTISLGFGKADGTADVGSTVLGGLLTPISVHIGYVDGQGDPYADVLVTHSGGIALYPGIGARAFGAPLNVESGVLGTNQANDVLLVDANRDGYVDIVVEDDNASSAGGTPSRSTVHILYGDGKHGFPRNVLYLTAPGPLAVVSADVTGDGRDDLITCGHQGDSSGTARIVSILRHR